jgi:glycosyl-4,4'-diaponeurosporenoate acyltransferase
MLAAMAIPPLSAWLSAWLKAMPCGSVAADGLHAWRPALGCGLGWLLWSLLVGYLGHRLPLSALDHDSWWSRPRPWGEPLAFYGQRLAIRRWKAWLPDAGALFPGGLLKGDLVGRDRSRLQRLVAETRRAEWVHLALWPCWLVLALGLPLLGLGLPPWGVAANLLCHGLQPAMPVVAALHPAAAGGAAGSAWALIPGLEPTPDRSRLERRLELATNGLVVWPE